MSSRWEKKGITYFFDNLMLSRQSVPAYHEDNAWKKVFLGQIQIAVS